MAIFQGVLNGLFQISPLFVPSVGSNGTIRHPIATINIVGLGITQASGSTGTVTVYPRIDTVTFPGSSITLNGPGTIYSNTISPVSIPGMSDTEVPAGSAIYESIDSSSTGGPTNVTSTFSYEVLAPYTNWNFMGAFLGYQAAGSTFYYSLLGNAISANDDITVQMPWPINGNFVSMIFTATNLGNTATIETALRKNGADTSLVGSLPTPSTISTKYHVVQSTVPISVGDLISIRYTVTGTSGNFSSLVILAFAGS